MVPIGIKGLRVTYYPSISTSLGIGRFPARLLHDITYIKEAFYSERATILSGCNAT